MAEALNMTAVLGFSVDCGHDGRDSPSNKADFVSYVFEAADGSQGKWGALRAMDGHPEPYTVTHVQLGNEENVAQLVGRFADAAAAMERRATQLGRGGVLTYVLGSDCRSDGGGSIVNDGNTSIILQELKAAGLCERTIWDWHVMPSVQGYNQSAARDTFNLAAFDNLRKKFNCPCRVAILEENLCQAHFTRALGDAFTSNFLQSQPLVAMQATSQIWSRAGNFNDGCGEGHVYTLPNQTWLSPPGWASSMTFNSFQPNALRVSWTRGGTGFPDQTVDVFAAVSDDEKELTIRLVNAGNQSRLLELMLLSSSAAGAVAVEAGSATLASLTSPLTGAAYTNQSGGVNPVGDPLLISPRMSNVSFDATGKVPHLLPAQSFQVLTMRLLKT